MLEITTITPKNKTLAKHDGPDCLDNNIPAELQAENICGIACVLNTQFVSYKPNASQAWSTIVHGN